MSICTCTGHSGARRSHLPSSFPMPMHRFFMRQGSGYHDNHGGDHGATMLGLFPLLAACTAAASAALDRPQYICLNSVGDPNQGNPGSFTQAAIDSTLHALNGSKVPRLHGVFLNGLCHVDTRCTSGQRTTTIVPRFRVCDPRQWRRRQSGGAAGVARPVAGAIRYQRPTRVGLD